MSIDIQTLINNGVFDIQLGVADPSSSGVAAGDGAIGKATDGTRWIKVGENDTDWEQILISTNQEFEANFQLADATGHVLGNNVLGHVNNVMVKGDGITTGGKPVGVGMPSYVTTTTAGVIEQIDGDIPDSFVSDNANLTTANSKGLVIGSSCTKIGTSSAGYGDGAFAGCSGLTGSLTIPDSVTSIGSYAFAYCDGFTGSLTIPDSVTSIGSRAFIDCSGFDGSLTIPDSVTTIGSASFVYCDGFTGALTIPDSVTSIGSDAFYGCSGFTGSLTIPDSVTDIGSFAFYGCSGFDGSLTIPDSVTTIGIYAFYNCSGITEIYIDSVNASAWTGSNALLGTTALTHIYVTNGSGGSTDVLSSYGSAPFQGCDGGVTIAAWTSYPDPMP